MVVSCKQLDFGTVFIRSESIKYFSVKNNTGRYVQLELAITEEELCKTKARKQIIPPGETGSFEVVLESRNSGDFKAVVKYSVNRSHTFEFVVMANLIPIAL
mgnify:CR=1 FL=1